MTARTTGTDTLTGFCHTEQLIRDGVVASTATAEEHHRLCPGNGVTVSRGRTRRCPCPHHEGEEYAPIDVSTVCTRCSYAGIDEERHPTEVGFRCNDVAGCNYRYDRKMKENPAFRKAVEFRERVEAQKLEIARAEAESGGGTSRARYGRCEFSGLPTKGGRFLPGNDAKLKSQLTRQAEDGDIDALAELMYRHWPATIIKYMQSPNHHRAHDLAFGDDADAWFQARLEARWAALEEA